MEFQWIKGSTTNPAVTIYANNLTLNNAAARHLENYRYCMLGIDHKTSTIAIKPVSKRDLDLKIYDPTHMNKISMGIQYAALPMISQNIAAKKVKRAVLYVVGLGYFEAHKAKLAKKKKRSLYRKQKRAVIVLAAVVLLLAIMLPVVNYFVGRDTFYDIDPDKTKYYVQKKVQIAKLVMA